MTDTPHKDHFRNPLEIGREYVYVYHNKTSIQFRRVRVLGFTPKMVRVTWADPRWATEPGTAVTGDKLFPVPA